MLLGLLDNVCPPAMTGQWARKPMLLRDPLYHPSPACLSLISLPLPQTVTILTLDRNSVTQILTLN